MSLEKRAAAELRTVPHAAPEPEPRLALTDVPLADVMTAWLPAPEHAISQLVPCGVLTLLGGHGGTGKSNLGLVLAAHKAAGRAWAGFLMSAGPTVFVTLEDTRDVVLWRLRRIIEEYELDPAAVLANLRILDGSTVDAELMRENSVLGVRELIETATLPELAERVRGAYLVLIDNASDAFGGAENDRRQVRRFIRRLSEIARENNAGIVLLAHIDKAAARFGSNGNTYSGSTAWHNSARSRLALVENDDGSIELRHEKANFGAKAETIPLEYGAHGVLLPRIVSHRNDQEIADNAGEDATTMLGVLKVALAAGLTVPVATTGPSHGMLVLETLPEMPAIFRGKNGRQRAAAALIRLSRESRIVRHAYQKPNRHAAERWELAQPASVEPPKSAPVISPHTPLGGTGATDARQSSPSEPTHNRRRTGATGAEESR